MDKIETKKLIMETLDGIEKLLNGLSAMMDACNTINRGDTVSVEDLGRMAARQIDVDPDCAVSVLNTAFKIVRDLELKVEVEDDDD